MTDRIIHTDACVAEGAAWLATAEPRFAEALDLTGPLPLRRRDGGFPALLNTICAQQLSVASAGTVWRKLLEAQATEADHLLAHDDDTLRACGLSRPKIRYARALAKADINYPALAHMPEEQAVATLTEVKGIGVWTAEIYLMFSVGRADVLAAGDLALQEAARILFDLPARPGDKELRALAEAWSPWRAVAARLLWAYYRVAKKREGVTEIPT
ncbi:MAG: DNA-3-methyladenine glycosylase 2 family protein [Pseudomonadota bacterium]